MKHDLVSAMKVIDAVFNGGEAFGYIASRETSVRVTYLDSATMRRLAEDLAHHWGVRLPRKGGIDPEFGEQLSLDQALQQQQQQQQLAAV